MNLENLLTAEMVMMAVVLVVIIVASVIILIKMKPLKDFDNIKFGKLELKRGKEEQNIDKQQNEALCAILERINKIDKRLDGMDKRMDAQYEYTRGAVVQAATSVVWGDTSPPFMEVIKAGLTNLMLGQNGNLITRMKHVIIGYNDQAVMYQSILNEFINNNKSKLNDHFYKCIAEIKSGIY
jgi:hypothetical protein